MSLAPVLIPHVLGSIMRARSREWVVLPQDDPEVMIDPSTCMMHAAVPLAGVGVKALGVLAVVAEAHDLHVA